MGWFSITTTSPPLAPFVAGSAAAADAIAAKSAAKSSASDKCFGILRSSLAWLEDFGGHKRARAGRHKPFERPLAKTEKQRRGENGVQQRGADQATEDGDGHRVKDLAARLARPDQ